VGTEKWRIRIFNFYSSAWRAARDFLVRVSRIGIGQIQMYHGMAADDHAVSRHLPQLLPGEHDAAGIDVVTLKNLGGERIIRIAVIKRKHHSVCRQWFSVAKRVDDFVQRENAITPDKIAHLPLEITGGNANDRSGVRIIVRVDYRIVSQDGNLAIRKQHAQKVKKSQDKIKPL
jgi:hypothetical protein